jgi:hypothetical protein
VGLVSLDALLGGPPRADRPLTARGAVIAVGTDVRVVIPAYSQVRDFEVPLDQWSGVAPAVGDECLLVFDNEGDAWGIGGGSPVGLPGPTGPVGPAGPQGPAGTPATRWRFASWFDGPCSTVGPPSGTSGTSFTVPQAGDYLVTWGGSAFKSSVGNGYLILWIDGVGLGPSAARMFTTVNVYATFSGMAAVVTLAAGTHYAWHQLNGTGLQSDGNSRFWMSVV